MLLTIFRCAPIDVQWDLDSEEGNCRFGTYQLFLGSSTPHIVTDVVLVGIPVPLIWNLHLHRSRKVILTAIFALGILYVALYLCFSTTTLPVLELKLAFLADECSASSVTVFSIVRLTYLIKDLSPGFPTLECPDIFIWTSVEANVSIICGQYMTALSVFTCPEKDVS